MSFRKKINRFLAEWVSAINALVAIGIPLRHWVSSCFAAAVALSAAVPIHAQSQWSLRRGAPSGAEIIVEVETTYIAAVAVQVVGVIGILILAYLLFRSWRRPGR